jgi:hypothetical protein
LIYIFEFLSYTEALGIRFSCLAFSCESSNIGVCRLGRTFEFERVAMSGHRFKKGDAVFYASSEGALPAIVTTIYGDGKASIDIREGIIRIDKLTKRECHVVGKKSSVPVSDGGNQENPEGDGDAPASGGGFNVLRRSVKRTSSRARPRSSGSRPVMTKAESWPVAAQGWPVAAQAQGCSVAAQAESCPVAGRAQAKTETQGWPVAATMTVTAQRG